eukprot:Skav218259  [mRNA]  locus=scaffold2035:139784:146102:- [translate_table: standard]
MVGGIAEVFAIVLHRPLLTCLRWLCEILGLRGSGWKSCTGLFLEELFSGARTRRSSRQKRAGSLAAQGDFVGLWVR